MKPYCFFDAETAVSGSRPDAARDKLLTLALTRIDGLSDEEPLSTVFRFNPHIAMSPENVAIHGITNEEAATFPDLTPQEANGILAFMEGSILVGFGIKQYDVPLLWEEFYRVGVEWDTSKVLFVDCGNIFKKKEKRSLSAALQFYCGRSHDGAHNALADVMATIDVFKAQIGRYPDVAGLSVEALAEFSSFNKAADLHGILALNEKDEVVFNTKRNRGVRVVDDTGYAEWMLHSDFPRNTHQVLNRVLKAYYAESEPSL